MPGSMRAALPSTSPRIAADSCVRRTGLVISAYHYVVEWNPSLETDVCSLDVPCTTIWFRQFEFMSLPFLAGCGFLALVSLMCVVISGRSSAPVTVDVGRSVDDD